MTNQKLQFVKKLKSRLGHIEKEALYERLLEEIQASDLYEEILNALAEGVIITDEGGSIQFLNHLAKSWLSLSEYDETQPLWELIEDSKLKRFLRDFYASSKEREVQSFKILSPREKYLRVHMSPLAGERGQKRLILLQDISSKSEETLERQRLSKMDSILKLVSGIAHEI